MSPRRADADARVDRGGDDADHARVGVHGDVGAALGRVIADDERHEDREQHSEPGDAAERDAPCRRMQQCSEGDQGDQLTGLPDDPGELHHDRTPLRGKPGRDES